MFLLLTSNCVGKTIANRLCLCFHPKWHWNCSLNKKHICKRSPLTFKKVMQKYCPYGGLNLRHLALIPFKNILSGAYTNLAMKHLWVTDK